MAPTSITEDYYKILNVKLTDTTEVIGKSYRQLAIKLHPDKNGKHNATEEFQKLARAWETLKDSDLREAYDLIYPSIAGNRTSSSGSYRQTQAPRPGHTPSTPPQSEEAQLATILKSKLERQIREQARQNAFEILRTRQQKNIQLLELQIKNLKKATAAAAKEEAYNSSFLAWVYTPPWGKTIEQQEYELRKEKEKQERLIETGLVERQLYLKRTELITKEIEHVTTTWLFHRVDTQDAERIRVLQQKIDARK